MTRRRAAALTAGVFLAFMGAEIVFPSAGEPPADVQPPARAIDFRRPSTLAWSVELVGASTEALSEVRCSTRGNGQFVCRGRTPNGARAIVRIVVDGEGASWRSR